AVVAGLERRAVLLLVPVTRSIATVVAVVALAVFLLAARIVAIVAAGSLASFAIPRLEPALTGGRVRVTRAGVSAARIGVPPRAVHTSEGRLVPIGKALAIGVELGRGPAPATAVSVVPAVVAAATAACVANRFATSGLVATLVDVAIAIALDGTPLAPLRRHHRRGSNRRLRRGGQRAQCEGGSERGGE